MAARTSTNDRFLGGGLAAARYTLTQKERKKERKKGKKMESGEDKNEKQMKERGRQ